MIRVNELRIGNYVTDQWNSNPSIVTSINEKGIDLEIEDDGNWPECARHWIEATTKEEKLFGVPLTEEILTKCGFQYCDGYGHRTKFGWIHKVNGIYYWKYHDIEVNIDSLHLLQNTYERFYQKELQITL